MKRACLTRTHWLTERTTTECRLSGADVEFLLAGHRSHLDLLPTSRRGSFRLTPSGIAGTIRAPHCRLVIRPKIPMENLGWLLDPGAPASETEDQVSAAPGSELLDLLARRLARLLDEQAAAGLHRAYIERAEVGRFLQGRLDVAAHLRAADGRKDRLHCITEDFTADVPCNQVPKSSAEELLRSTLLGSSARAALRRALTAFADIQSVALDAVAFAAAVPDSRQAGTADQYRRLRDLCQLLAEGLSATELDGGLSTAAFLIDMERIFERYLTIAVQRTFADQQRYRVQVQPCYSIHPAASDQPAFQLRPDVVVERDDIPWLVIDAKWKELSGSALNSEDVHQVLAYGATLGTRRVALVYPGARFRCWHYPLRRAPHSLEVYTIAVTGPRERLARSVERLGTALRRDPGRTRDER